MGKKLLIEQGDRYDRLTIVNEDAASALPWLYQSVSHF